MLKRMGYGFQLAGPWTAFGMTSGSPCASYFAGGPMVTEIVPTPSISPASRSPATTGPTPAGVPVMMMSPGASATISESFSMISGTVQINWERLPFWRTLPLHLSAILPALGWPIAEAGASAPQGAEASNALPISQARLISRGGMPAGRAG